MQEKMKRQSKTTRHWHIRQTPSGCVPVREHFMHFWHSLSPEQKQEGRNAFLRVAYNRYLRTRDPAIARRLLAQIQGRQGSNACNLIPQPPDSKFPKVELEAGTNVEMEHTKDPEVAKQISKAHLMEDADYYSKLRIMERGGELLDKLESGVLDPKELSDEDRLAVIQEQERRLFQSRRRVHTKTIYEEAVKEGKVQ